MRKSILPDWLAQLADVECKLKPWGKPEGRLQLLVSFSFFLFFFWMHILLSFPFSIVYIKPQLLIHLIHLVSLGKPLKNHRDFVNFHVIKRHSGRCTFHSTIKLKFHWIPVDFERPVEISSPEIKRNADGPIGKPTISCQNAQKRHEIVPMWKLTIKNAVKSSGDVETFKRVKVLPSIDALKLMNHSILSNVPTSFKRVKVLPSINVLKLMNQSTFSNVPTSFKEFSSICRWSG